MKAGCGLAAARTQTAACTAAPRRAPPLLCKQYPNVRHGTAGVRTAGGTPTEPTPTERDWGNEEPGPPYRERARRQRYRPSQKFLKRESLTSSS